MLEGRGVLLGRVPGRGGCCWAVYREGGGGLKKVC